jgi:hypothetical protein
MLRIAFALVFLVNPSGWASTPLRTDYVVGRNPELTCANLVRLGSMFKPEARREQPWWELRLDQMRALRIEASAGPHIHRSLSGWDSKVLNGDQPFLLVNSTEDRKILCYANLFGERVCYEHRQAGDYDLAPSSGWVVIKHFRRSPVNIPRDFVLPSDHEAFAQQLATVHLNSSTTHLNDPTQDYSLLGMLSPVAEIDPTLSERDEREALSRQEASARFRAKRERMREGQLEAERAMLRLLVSGEKLTVSDVLLWNRLIVRASADTLPEAMLGGVLRGTAQVFWENGTMYQVDLTHDTGFAIELFGGQYLLVTADELIPARVTALVAEASQINRESRFRDSLHIFREMMYDHGLPVANGRTFRILLDYCLMKSGFRPIPDRKRVPVYWSDDADAEAEVASGYL